MNTAKILVTGLPRTGTTSVCIAALHLGIKTAHTAYTREALGQAQLLADTPVFCDYKNLVTIYPNSKLLHLSRPFELWLPSIKRLMTAMQNNLLSQRGGFNDTIKRCYLSVFPEFDKHFDSDNFWFDCYQRHQQQVYQFAQQHQLPLLDVTIDQADIGSQLAAYIGNGKAGTVAVPHVNIGGKVTAWKWISHPLKVESTRAGKADKDALLYSEPFANT
ncbi:MULTISPECIES: sulfotransferase [unclassified Pseudoalteromonas]|uniref:sulfotransferase n=1 Tax=unclassified Pseudoalteromonas TaxID=194690 RepID=UPI003014225D